MKNIAQRQRSVCLCIFLFSIVATGLVPADAWADGCTITGGGTVAIPDDNSIITCTGECDDTVVGKASSEYVTINIESNMYFNDLVVIHGGKHGIINVGADSFIAGRVFVGTDGSITTEGEIEAGADNGTDNVCGVILLESGSTAPVNGGKIKHAKNPDLCG